ncbi:MAG: flagellar export chaperone FliS [Alphaproteobacteria bacterium]|uniref:Flagellar secretion chaperone FliS n=1 Tax=Candidatus Nitrobium versatile TaxID=2884831 RepID=A0A953J4R1_9BACT|nr:flagellar export chaperone FliS [Candidatus Nitrobium versatile]
MKNEAVTQYRENNIASASPEETVLMLYNGAIKFLRDALGEVGRNTENKIILIDKSLKIIEYLQSCLNMEKGGEIAHNLNDLYDYIMVQITRANFKNDATMINEVIRLLLPIRDAWAEICRKGSRKPSPLPYGGKSEEAQSTKKIAVSV